METFTALCFNGMFETLLNKTKKLKLPTVKEIFRELFLDKEFTDFIIELNTISQLYKKGQDSTGDSIGEYSDATIYGTVNFKGKEAKNQPFDRVTLKDTGAFYESFKCKYLANKDGEIQITANTMKNEVDLLNEWGRDIIGLSEESLETLRSLAKKKLKLLIINYQKNGFRIFYKAA